MNKLNILISYPYCSKNLMENMKKFPKNNIRFLLDCGAYTAWTTGKKIQLDDYCKFIENCKPKPWRYFTLDVIGNPEKTATNFEIMLQRGFKPVPIYTPGEDKKAIEYFYNKSDVVGFGGINGFKGQKRKGYVNGIMKAAKGRKVHLLGFTDNIYLKAYKPYMCDSSTWESARFGNINLYLGQGKTKIIKRIKSKNKFSTEIHNTIKKMGINPYRMSKEKSWRGGKSLSRQLCAKSGVLMSVDFEKYINTKYFLAAEPSGYDLLANAFKELYLKEIA
jgi:hypothetical protein